MEHDFSMIFFKMPPLDPATRDEVIRDLERVRTSVLEVCKEPIVVRFEAPAEVIAALEEQLPRAAEQLRAEGWSVAGVPLVLDDDLPAHAMRIRFSDKSWKIVSVRAGLNGAVLDQGMEAA